MGYVPDWETLAETLGRVMTTNELSRSKAKLDICRALREAKLRPRYWVERVQTPDGFDLDLRAVGQPRSRFDQRDLIGQPRVPPDLIPDDIDWVNSRPKSPWLDKRRFRVGIAKIEFLTADVIRVLCRSRTGRAASDALLGGSPAGLEVQAPEPLSPPTSDVAFAEQVASPKVQTPEPVPTPKTDVATADLVAPRRRRSSAKRDRAQRAIGEEYPGGVPEGTTDMELLRAVGRKLGADTPSLETVRRAAGRRSN
jgi:hypothetical protein